MRFGEGGPWRPWPAVPAWCRLGVVLCLLAGCAPVRPHVDQALKSDHGGPVRNQGVAEQYVIRCPDVLEIAVDGRPDLPARAVLGPDGRLDRDDLGRPRVEGQTAAETGRAVAAALGVPSETVRVHVEEYNSQQVYLFGEVIGQHRTVPYQGPETVLDLLQRVGGITPGAAEGDVHVIRSHVADGRDPEVFHIDLRAIAVHQDEGTNVRLQPFDQVYVGQTRRAVLQRCMPPWLRPAYEAVFGMRRKP
jgi:protein involved in polysaccharide export with SLBB domain